MNFIPHTKEESLQIIKDLVARFKQNEKSYTSVIYDESNTRTDFIDKFFEALNWDVRNDNGFAERFREVVREDKVVINGQTKAPDYSFRLGGQKIFFVEAKKPSVNIKDDIAPAYQLRRYAYTAKLPLSILTDFEEFAVFDTKIKPNPNDKASAARIQYMRYDHMKKILIIYGIHFPKKQFRLEVLTNIVNLGKTSAEPAKLITNFYLQ